MEHISNLESLRYGTSFNFNHNLSPTELFSQVTHPIISVACGLQSDLTQALWETDLKQRKKVMLELASGQLSFDEAMKILAVEATVRGIKKQRLLLQEKNLSPKLLYLARMANRRRSVQFPVETQLRFGGAIGFIRQGNEALITFVERLVGGGLIESSGIGLITRHGIAEEKEINRRWQQAKGLLNPLSTKLGELGIQYELADEGVALQNI